MTQPNSARQVAKMARKKRCSEREVAETRDYRVRPHGDSLVSTISPTAQNVLGIEAGTELTQFVDYESGAIILVPSEEEVR